MNKDNRVYAILIILAALVFISFVASDEHEKPKKVVIYTNTHRNHDINYVEDDLDKDLVPVYVQPRPIRYYTTPINIYHPNIPIKSHLNRKLGRYKIIAAPESSFSRDSRLALWLLRLAPD